MAIRYCSTNGHVIYQVDMSMSPIPPIPPKVKTLLTLATSTGKTFT
ncbi:MAG: hypothetical protein WCT12_17230 [Verrucomicrobiota bacterium]